MGTDPHRRRGRWKYGRTPSGRHGTHPGHLHRHAFSNEKGEFQLPLGQQKLPLYLVVTYIGYDTARVLVQALKPLRIPLGEKKSSSKPWKS